MKGVNKSRLLPFALCLFLCSYFVVGSSVRLFQRSTMDEADVEGMRRLQPWGSGLNHTTHLWHIWTLKSALSFMPTS